MPRPSQPKADREPRVTAGTLRKRGWTDTLVGRFLPEPDATAVNPHYRTGPPMKLYALARVERIEATEEFQAARDAALIRQAASRKAVETKLAKMRALLDAVTIAVPLLSPDQLAPRACRHYNARKADWAEDRGLYDLDWRAADPASSSPEFLARITVNYLRHQLTSYEDELNRTAGKVGAAGAYLEIKTKVLDAIAAAYPELAGACRRQVERLGIESEPPVESPPS